MGAGGAAGAAAGAVATAAATGACATSAAASVEYQQPRLDGSASAVAERDASLRSQSRLAPAILIAYGWIFTLVGFDFFMSLEPHWFSTLAGGYYFIGNLFIGIAFLSVIAVWSRDKLQLAHYIGSHQLHDIGKLILIEYFPDEFGEALDRARDDLLSIAEAEEQVIGVTHAQIGGWLAEKWKLPESLVEAIAYHHAPQDVEEPDEILIITHMANALTRHNRIGSGGDRLGASLSPGVAEVFKNGRDISDDILLAGLSEGFREEIETARVFTDLEGELFETPGDNPTTEDDGGGAPVGA